MSDLVNYRRAIHGLLEQGYSIKKLQKCIKLIKKEEAEEREESQARQKERYYSEEIE